MVILNLPLSTMITNTWCHPLIDTWNLSLDASPWESPNPQKHRQHIVWVSTESAIDNFLSYHKILCGASFALVCWPFRVRSLSFILVNLYLYFMFNLDVLKGILNSSLEQLAWILDQSLLNTWVHYDHIFEPLLEFIIQIILLRSWSIMAQTIALSMATLNILQWTSFWSSQCNCCFKGLPLFFNHIPMGLTFKCISQCKH